MNTINLVKFERNENNTGITGAVGEDVTWLLKDAFIKVFQEVVNKLKSGFYPDFVKNVWISACDEGVIVAERSLKQLGIRNNKVFAKEDIDRICNKFRGNCGEIFAELYFTSGKCSICKNNVYTCVNPTNEDYTDAATVHKNTRLPIDIQVKNWANLNVDDIVFAKAGTTAYLKAVAFEKNEDKLFYMSTAHQIIFSATDVKDGRLLDRYNKVVMFIGPNEINKAGFQGDKKSNVAPDFGSFEDIIEEIKNL